MHCYSINNNSRKTIYFYLALVSIGTMYLLKEILIKIPWYFENLSPFAFYCVYFYFFDKVLWKMKLISYFIKIPNMNGKYVGILNSSFDEFKKDYNASVNVKQTWTEIIITLKTETSESNSHSATIIFKNEKIYLLYSYLNEPKNDSNNSMYIHYGTCTHVYDKEENTFNAEYYSDGSRKTYGRIFLKKN